VVLPNLHAVAKLRDLLLEVAAGREVGLEHEKDIKLVGFASLRLRNTAEASDKKLSQDKSGFVWSGPASYWQDRAEMVAVLLRQKGHQYLADIPDDDAVIEVSYGEHHKVA
jgi:hypothetical protein